MSLRRAARPTRGWTRRPRLPQRTVRLRLTLIYGALFLLSGAAVLAIAYTLTWNATSLKVLSSEFRAAACTGGVPYRAEQGQPASCSATVLGRQQTQALTGQIGRLEDQHAVLMDRLLISCAIALAIMAVLSITLGWLVAGLGAESAANHDRSHSVHQRAEPERAARGRRSRRRAQAAG